MMFVTDGLKNQVQDILLRLDERSAFMNVQLPQQPAWWSDVVYRWAAERALYVAVECVTDAAALVIDTLVMRDPANYEDMLRVLKEESVVTSAWYEAVVPVFQARSRLVREFAALTPEQVKQDVEQFAPLFDEFADKLRVYLGISAA